MWAKTFAQSQKVYQVVYLKTANPILIIVKNWSFVKPQKDLARAHAQLWVKNLWILKLSSFWPQIASEVGSDVPDPGAVPLKWGCWTTLFFIRRRIHQNIKQRQTSQNCGFILRVSKSPYSPELDIARIKGTSNYAQIFINTHWKTEQNISFFKDQNVTMVTS